MISYNS